MSSRQPISSLPPSSLGCFFSLICCSGSLQLQQEGGGEMEREEGSGDGEREREGKEARPPYTGNE